MRAQLVEERILGVLHDRVQLTERARKALANALAWSDDERRDPGVARRARLARAVPVRRARDRSEVRRACELDAALDTRGTDAMPDRP